jgi:hypothetical protein
MRKVWPWAVTSGGVLLAGLVAAYSSGSVLVALAGGFVATQLVAPSLLDLRRPAPAPVASAQPAGVRARVRWVRVDVKPRGVTVPVISTASAAMATMSLAPSARRTP